MENRTLMFLHIPKCAGTSLLKHLERDVPLTRIYKNTSIFENFRYGREEIYNLSETAIGELRIVWGHHLHEQMLKIYFSSNTVLLSTILREPIERFMSHIEYDVRTCMTRGVAYDIEKAISDCQNPICNFLIERFPTFAENGVTLSEKAINILKKFDSVHTIENIGSAIELFQKFLEIKVDLNVTKENSSDYDLDIGKIVNFELLRENLKDDIRVYEFFENQKTTRIDEIILNVEKNTITRLDELSEDLASLKSFLVQKVKIEYSSWSVLGKAIEQKLKLISSVADEIQILRSDLHN